MNVKIKGKFLSLVLCGVLIGNIFPANAFAETGKHFEQEQMVYDSSENMSVNKSEMFSDEKSNEMHSNANICNLSANTARITSSPLSMDTRYVCEKGSTTTITASFMSENEPANISWKCSNSSGISFSGTSTQPPSVTGEANVWWISVMVSGQITGTYDVSLTISSENETYTAVTTLVVTDLLGTGILKNIDASSNLLTIDDSVYPVMPDCNLNYAREVMAGSDSRQVVFSINDGKIAMIRSIYDVLCPKIKLTASPDSFVYKNGEYNQETLSLSIKISCAVSPQSPFSSASLSAIDGLSINLKEFELTCGSDLINFGTSGAVFKRNVSSIQKKGIDIAYGKDASFQCTVYINEELIPSAVTTKVDISSKVILDGKTDDIISNTVYVTVGNLDLQKQQISIKKSQSGYNTNVNAVKSALNKCTAVSLDANISNYFTNAQQSEIINFLTVYMAEVLSTNELQKPGIFEKLEDDMLKKVRDKLLSKLGVSYSTFLFTKTTEFSVEVQGKAKSGQTVTIKFDVAIDDYRIGDNDPYGALAVINYTVTDKNAIPDGASATGTGMATLANMESFANSVPDFLKVAYNEAWGKKANEIASMFEAKPFDILLKGDYSGNLYKLMTNTSQKRMTRNAFNDSVNEIHYTKKVSIEGSVDVYVYDDKGTLCGKIVDEIVDGLYQDIVLNVNDTKKHIYLADGDYQIKLVGKQKDAIEYIIQEYVDEKCIRTVKTSDVEVSSGVTYETTLSSIPYIDHDIYALYDGQNSIDITYDDYQGIEERNQAIERSVIYSATNDNITYTRYSDGLLELSGSGAMKDFDNLNNRSPWSMSSVKHIVINEGITSIGDFAFNLSSVEIVDIADSVESIGRCAFHKCPKLRWISIGKGLKEFGQWSLSYDYSLYKIDVSSQNMNFKSIDNILYSYDGKILYRYPHNGVVDYVISEGVAEIYHDAFGDIETLQTISFPKTMVSIGSEIFDGCNNLKKIYGYTNSIEQAYAKSSDLEFVSLGKKDCKGLCGERTSEGECGDNAKWTLDEGVFTVTGLGKIDYPWYSRVWSLCSSELFEKIEIGDGVTEIGKDIFSNCKYLKEVIIPESVIDITENTFYNLDKIIIKGNNAYSKRWEDGEWHGFEVNFKDCKFRTAGPIGGGYDYEFGWKTRIPFNAFYGCTELTSITIPESVTGMSEDMFKDCNLDNFIIYGYKNSYAETYAKENNICFSSLGDATLNQTNKPNTTTSPKPTIKPDVTVSPKPNDNSNTTASPKPTGDLGATTTPLSGTLLKDDKNKVSYKVIAQGKTVSFNGISNKKATKVVVPTTITINEIKYKVTAISDNAFNGCKRLKSITIGTNVTKIGNKAFLKCISLKKIVIPANVTKIGNKAFYGCKKLKSIIIKSKKLRNKSVGTQAFKGIYIRAVIKVPKKQKKTYIKWLKKKGVAKTANIK